MELLQKNENGFVSFFALMALIATAFMGGGLFLVMKENIETERHHEIALQLRYDAEGAIEKIVHDIENKYFIIPEDIKDIGEYVVPKENLPPIGYENKKLKVSVKYENNGIRILAVTEKTDEPYIILGTAEGFMENVEDVYKWKYWIKTK